MAKHHPRRSRDVAGSTAVSAPDEPITARSVRALQRGFYNGQRIRVGQIFNLLKPEHFSKKWMIALSDENEPDVASRLAHAESAISTAKSPFSSKSPFAE